MPRRVHVYKRVPCLPNMRVLALLCVLCVLPRADGAFAVIGDWGRGGTADQRRVASLMRAHDVSFVVSTGDNFYPRGLTSTSDPRLLQWEEVYAPRIPWYLALGNHDYRGNASAQVALTEVLTFWNMPAPYYDAVVDGVHLFVLDTTPWVSGADVAAQRAWLRAGWRSSNAVRKVMVGHHPLWTCGYHHDRDAMEDLRATVLPLLDGAPYIAGHDHNLQHIVRAGARTFVSGAGASTYAVHDCPGLRYGNGDEVGFLLVEGDSYAFVTASGVREV